MPRFRFSLRTLFIVLTASICLWSAAIEKIEIKQGIVVAPSVEVRTRLRWHFHLHRFHWSIHDLDRDEKKEGSFWVLRCFNVPTRSTITFDNETGHWREYGRRGEVVYFDYREQAKASRALDREIRLFKSPALMLAAIALLGGAYWLVQILIDVHFDAQQKYEHFAVALMDTCFGPVAVFFWLLACLSFLFAVTHCFLLFAFDVYSICSGA